MAKFGPWLKGVIVIAGVDLSARCENMTLTLAKDDIDMTAFGDGGHIHAAGLENDKLVATFFQDYAASQVDAVLMPVFQAGTAVAFKVAASPSPYSATVNPTYSGSVVLIDYTPLGGKVGDALQTPVTFVISGTVTEGTT